MLERDQALARSAGAETSPSSRAAERRRGDGAGGLESWPRRPVSCEDKNINELGAKCADLQAKMERAARDQRSAERERASLLEDVESERKRLRATIDDFAARTKESVERRDRAEAKMQSTLQDLAEKEQEMAIARAELADRVTHLQVRIHFELH